MRKKAIICILMTCMVLSLCACGQKELSPQEAREALKETSIQEEQQESSVQETPTQEEKSLSDFVTMTNITIAPIEVYSASVDSYEPDKGYVIEATVSNENDISCDVSPVLSAVIKDADNYGKEQSKEVILDLSSPVISSPYCYAGAYGTDSIGLAPQETKTVRYYIGAGGGSNTRLYATEIDTMVSASKL